MREADASKIILIDIVMRIQKCAVVYCLAVNNKFDVIQEDIHEDFDMHGGIILVSKAAAECPNRSCISKFNIAAPRQIKEDRKVIFASDEVLGNDIERGVIKAGSSVHIQLDLIVIKIAVSVTIHGRVVEDKRLVLHGAEAAFNQGGTESDEGWPVGLLGLTISSDGWDLAEGVGW